jgi:hypothetical protein
MMSAPVQSPFGHPPLDFQQLMERLGVLVGRVLFRLRRRPAARPDTSIAWEDGEAERPPEARL